jgi:hypothetical protein
VLVTATIPAGAHHSFQAQFDEKNQFQLTGVLTKVEWINPHAYFHLDVKDESGKVTNWDIETFGPAGLRRAGLSRAGLFETGLTYTFTVCGGRVEGAKIGWLKDIKFPDGRLLTIWWGNTKNVN